MTADKVSPVKLVRFRLTIVTSVPRTPARWLHQAGDPTVAAGFSMVPALGGAKEQMEPITAIPGGQLADVPCAQAIRYEKSVVGSRSKMRKRSCRIRHLSHLPPTVSDAR
jgi:hypothetical protein